MQKYVKLNLYYLGESSKGHKIYRASKWNKSLENLGGKLVLTESFEEIGKIKEIFGPITLPFISIKIVPEKRFNPNDNLYAKMR